MFFGKKKQSFFQYLTIGSRLIPRSDRKRNKVVFTFIEIPHQIIIEILFWEFFFKILDFCVHFPKLLRLVLAKFGLDRSIYSRSILKFKTFFKVIDAVFFIYRIDPYRIFICGSWSGYLDRNQLRTNSNLFLFWRKLNI